MENSWNRFEIPMPSEGQNVEIVLRHEPEGFREAHYDGRCFRVGRDTYLPAHCGGSVIAWRYPKRYAVGVG